MAARDPRPERTELTDQERLDNLARGYVESALRDCVAAGWLAFRDAPNGVSYDHDVAATGAHVIRRLAQGGLVVTPAEESDSLL